MENEAERACFTLGILSGGLGGRRPPIHSNIPRSDHIYISATLVILLTALLTYSSIRPNSLTFKARELVFFGLDSLKIERFLAVRVHHL